jgi:hypothetical protein
VKLYDCVAQECLKEWTVRQMIAMNFYNTILIRRLIKK